MPQAYLCKYANAIELPLQIHRHFSHNGFLVKKYPYAAISLKKAIIGKFFENFCPLRLFFSLIIKCSIAERATNTQCLLIYKLVDTSKAPAYTVY